MEQFQVEKNGSGAPRVTVILPVYNSGPYLGTAVRSILNQTFTDYTLVILNDGSTDDTEAVIREFSDKRIRYIKHASNQGLIATLNEGLAMAGSEYIIRMDADDSSLPDRFSKQVAFMDENKGIAISGTWLSVMGTAKKIVHPATPEECSVMLLQNTVMGHPSVIMRRDAIVQHQLKYNAGALHAEDYRFWIDAALCGLKLANLTEALIEYRTHPAQVSATYAETQQQTVTALRIKYARNFFDDLSEMEWAVYSAIFNFSIKTFKAFDAAGELVQQLRLENRSKKYFDEKLFNRLFDGYLTEAKRNLYHSCLDCHPDTLGKALVDQQFYLHTSARQKARFIFRSLKWGVS